MRCLTMSKKIYLIDNEELMKEWNKEKNGLLNPKLLTLKSHKKIWWRCKNGHEWQVSIDSRSKGTGCPYCSNRRVLKGYNDLETINSKLAKEWNKEKNGDLKPNMVMANSSKKVWWKCSKCGFEWKAKIDNRNRGKGCPNFRTHKKNMQIARKGDKFENI